MTFAAYIAVPIAAVLWGAGLVLFVRAELSTRHKITWTGVLLVVGAIAGAALPLAQVWNKLLIALAILPILAIADVGLFRSSRTFSFWLRACGFEVGTIFLIAIGLRAVLDSIGVSPIVRFAR